MTDKPKSIPTTDPHHVLPTFVNSVVASGHFNGVANLTFAVAQFTPQGDGSIDTDLVINLRLRMDMLCVQQLRDTCESILQQNLAPSNGSTH